MKDSFSGFHPSVNFIYFTAVILFSMLLMHPVFLGISLFSGLCYSIRLGGKKAVRFSLVCLLPMLVIMSALNPLFNHAGVTILFYLKSGNPFTLESVFYGIAAATMLVSVVCWFSCYSAVMTSDKFICLFGRIIPAFSLILSMTLRFVPRFRTRLEAVSRSRRCIHRNAPDGGLMRKARNGVRTLSALTTWALESSIETADSMKARGYGLPGRTAFSLCPVAKRDIIALCASAALSAAVFAGVCFGVAGVKYFPHFDAVPLSPATAATAAAYLGLCLIPVIVDVWEDAKWKHMRSAI